MVKKISKLLFEEVVHLSIDENESENQAMDELMAKELSQKIRRTDSDIKTVKLDLIETNESSNDRTLYEDNGVFRFNGSIDFESNDIKGVQKILANICADEKLCNTLFSFDFKTIELLSKINEFIAQQSFKKLNTFSFGTFINLTNFVEHYNSFKADRKTNVAKEHISAHFQHDRERLLILFWLTSGGSHRKNTNNNSNFGYILKYEYSSINSCVVVVEGTKMKVYFTLKSPPILYNYKRDNESKYFAENKFCGQ
jgi:hypothetical protein